MKENCGSQDQIWAAYGGLNYIKFYQNESTKIKGINSGRITLVEILRYLNYP